MEEKINAQIVLAVKYERNKLLERPRLRRLD
jgi:hypothetical protein